MREWKLDQLENDVDESVWLEAEALSDRKAVRDLEETFPELRARVMSGTEIYHCKCELKGSLTVTKAFCDCSAFKENKACAHWVAFAVSVRKHLDRNRRSASAPRFDLELIGSEIPFPDLWTFIRQYVKRDKELEWMMKARFARHIPVLEEDKYRKLLDQVLPATQEVRARKPHKRFKQALKIILILRDEAMDALALEEYKEAFIIAEATLPKLCILLRDQMTIDPATLELFNYFVAFIKKVHDQPIPSALRERIELWCLDLSCRSYFPNKRGHDSFYLELAEWLLEKDHLWPDSRSLLQTKYNYAKKLGQDIAFLAQAYMLYLISEGEDLYKANLNDLIRQLDKGQQLIHYAQYHLPEQTCARLLMLMSEIMSGTPLERTIHEALFQVFSTMKDQESRKKWAIELLRHRFIPECYDAISEGHENVNDAFEKWLTQEIFSGMTDQKQKEYLASYYSHTQQWKKLGDLVHHIDIGLLYRHDEKLFQYSPEEGILIYQRLIHDFLKDHHGPAASHFIGEIKAHLFSIEAGQYWKRIAQHTLEEFGDRPSVLSGIYDS